MVKQKKSISVSEKERRLDEEPKWEDHIQQSSMVKDGLPVYAAVNASVLPVLTSAESVSMATKRTRSRPQPTVPSKDPKAAAENDTSMTEVELQLPDGAPCQPPVAVHQIATRSTTGRLAKRPKQEIPSKKIPPKKQTKEVQQVAAEGGNVEPARSRRPWELWGTEDTNLFFEALFEHGKDFDAIQTFMAQRHKKRGDSESGAKTKDQIRHFYYRTSHKISNHIKLSSAADDSRKQALELYGLVCYGEIRRKSLLKVDKIWSRLNELLTQGSTMIRVRGKNLRIKVPQCRALKRLYNVEEQRDDSKLKLPEKVTLKMHPRTNAAWSHVQMLSQNPRLLVNVQPDQHLSAIFDYLNRKWRLECLQMKEALGKKVVDPLELRLHVSSEYTLAPISISRSNSQPKLDFSFEHFLENIKNSVPALSTSVSPPNKRTLKMVTPRIEDPSPPKNRSVAETVKSSNNSSEEDPLRILPQPSLSNSLASEGTGVTDNSAVAMETDDDHVCDVNATAEFLPSNRSDAPCVYPDTLLCSTAEGGTDVLTAVGSNGCLNSLHLPSSEVATASTAPTALSTVGTTFSTVAALTLSAVATMPLAATTLALIATPLSVIVPSLSDATSSISAMPSSVGMKTSATTLSSSSATVASSVTMAMMSGSAAACSSAAVPTCESLLVIRLSGPINRTLAEEVTIAELFIMAGRPKELVLEYDWTRKCSSTATVEQSVSIGSALHQLTSVALNEFAGFSRTASTGRLGAMSPPQTALGFKLDANSTCAKGPVRSSRVRQSRKESFSKAPDASLDQSANYPWSNASALVTPFDATNLLSTPSLYTFSSPVSSVLSTISTPVTMVTYSSAVAGDGNSPKTLMTPNSEGVFRVPKSLPPKLQAKSTDGRTIVDKKILDGLGIYHSKRSELLMPRKARSRNSRKPLVIQRTLLPKSQLQTSQIVTLTLVPGLASAQTGSFLPVACSAALSSQLAPTTRAPETMKPTTAISSAQQNVIKMAPTELKSTGIRRIVPVPVPADTVAVFPAVDRLVSSSQNDVVITTVSNGNRDVDQTATTSSLISESSLPNAITGIDAFLQLSESQDAISVQQGMTQSLAPTLTTSFIPSLGDSNLSIPSLLDISLPEGGTDSSDRFLADMDLMNSNSSFTPGFLNTVDEKNTSSNLSLPNDDSLLNSVKHLPGLTVNAETWYNNEESLSNLLPNFASVKKDFGKSLATPAAASIMMTTQSMHSNVFINDNSRESSMFSSLNTMEVNFQSAMDEENTFEIGSNFKQVVEQQSSDPYCQLRTLTSESSSNYIRNT